LALRKQFPRSGHATLSPSTRDAISILENQRRSRIEDFVPTRVRTKCPEIIVCPGLSARQRASICQPDAEAPGRREQALRKPCLRRTMRGWLGRHPLMVLKIGCNR